MSISAFRKKKLLYVFNVFFGESLLLLSDIQGMELFKIFNE